MSATTISILGCGWLGFPLGQYLKSLQYTVKGSTTHPEKISSLEKVGISPYLIHCQPQVVGDHLKDFLEANILFLNIPYQRDLKDPYYYKEQIKSVVASVDSSPIDFVIFASSTSVYPEQDGLALEEQTIIPDDPRAEVLLEIEEMLLRSRHFAATVLRFAGLYGGTRKIGQFLSGKTSLTDGSSPVNLVHLDDCIQIIAQIIQQNVRGDIFNVCSDAHPSRKELYSKAAQRLNLPPPQFDDSSHGRHKIVSNRKLKERLQYQFIHPDPSAL